MRLLRSLVLLVALPLIGACVTASDLRGIADRVDAAERTAADRYASQEDVQDSLAAVGDEIGAVAQRVEDRAKAWWETTDGLAGGGVLGLLSSVGTIMYRNAQRRARGEPVTVAEARAQSGAGSA